MPPRTTDRPRAPEALLSVVLPVFNELEILPRLHWLVRDALQSTGCRFEIVFINDGSTDGSGRVLDDLAATDPTVRVLHLSRNFGHQAAVQAGLQQARGDAVIVMDSDLQDDPQAIPRLVAEWQAGCDVVYAVRQERKESAWKRSLFYSFYRLLNAVSSTPFPSDAGNFGLLDRRIVQQVAELPESDRYFAGLRGWVGFRQKGIAVERLARYDAQPRVSLRGLFRLAKTALFSFSAAPLSLFYAIAALSLLVCVGGSSFVLYFKLIARQATPGWTSTVLVASFFGAINALGIAVLGEYIVRIYDQVRGRPKFIIARETQLQSAAASQASGAEHAPPSKGGGLTEQELKELLNLAHEVRTLAATGRGQTTSREPAHVDD